MVSTDIRQSARFKSVPILICGYPKATIGIILFCFTIAFFQIYNPVTNEFYIKVDTSERSLLGEKHEGWEFYQLALKTFGNDETILVAIDTDNVFLPESIDTITRLTTKLSNISGAQSVVSFTNALTIRNTEYGIDIAPMMEKLPQSEEDYITLRHDVLNNPLIATSLISKDYKTTAILVNLKNNESLQYLKQIKTDIESIIKSESNGVRISVTGAPLIKLATTEIVLQDLVKFPPMITAVMMILLWLLLRSIVSVLVTLMTVAISVAMTLATIVSLGYSLNILTALVPPLLMILTLSYTMYVISDFRAAIHQEQLDINKNASILFRISLPLMLAGLTTSIGFSTLYFSNLNAIREFGLFAVIGVVYAIVITLTFTPAVLVLFQRYLTPVYKNQTSNKSNTFDTILNHVSTFDSRHRIAIFLIVGVICAVSIAGMMNLRVGIEHISNFSPDSEIRQSFETTNKKLNGINPFNIVVQSKIPNAFKDPANLKQIESLQLWLESQPEIGGVTSLVNYIKFINRAFHEDDDEFDTIPESKRVIGQLLFFTGNDDTKRLVDSSYRALNIIVRTKIIDSDDISRLVERVNVRLKQLPDHMTARATGNPVLMNRAIQDIMWGQVESVFITLVIVYFILSSLFLSFKIGLLAIIPNILPVVVYFGTLGLTGISLNPSTSLIAPMIIGVAIDDTIHYFTHFNRIARSEHNPEIATKMTLGVVGRPITYTSLALCIGFLLLTTSDLGMQAQVGAMASFTLLVAWLSDFFLTPALCSRMKIATLWDVLTLDLGKHPQYTIPLFKGLNNFQTRIVVRLASIKKVRSGERLFETGQPGKEMYTVVDGCLRASITNNGTTIILEEMTRGKTFGEAGLFLKARGADVDVIEDARLIRISLENLQTIKQRYPRIAAQIFYNLNEILSTRLTRTNKRLTKK